jgi:hypothetical protein
MLIIEHLFEDLFGKLRYHCHGYTFLELILKIT